MKCRLYNLLITYKVNHTDRANWDIKLKFRKWHGAARDHRIFTERKFPFEVL